MVQIVWCNMLMPKVCRRSGSFQQIRTKRKEVLDLYRLFTTYYDDDVTAFVYCQLLPNKKMAHDFLTQGAPFGEKMSYKMSFGSIAGALKKECAVDAKSADERLKGIREMFDKVGGILADGRRYLTGDKVSLADIAFAAISGPAHYT